MELKKVYCNLIEAKKQEYLDKGFEVKTQQSISVKDGFYIIDLVAIKENEKIGLMIGNIKEEKLESIKEQFTELIVIPYISKSNDGYCKHLCGYIWPSRVEKPKQCPKCKTYLDW